MAMSETMKLGGFNNWKNTTLHAKFRRNIGKATGDIYEQFFDKCQPYWIFEICSFSLKATKMFIVNCVKTYFHNI